MTTYAYDAAGNLATVTDPAGIKTRTFYDNLGRATYTVSAWDGSFDPTGGSLPSSDNANQTTKTTYDGDNHQLTLTAILPSGEDTQTTQYIYNVSDAGVSSPVVYSNDLLWLVKYPDKSTGAASSSASDQNSFTYDALGDMLTKTDQNGTTHTYGYDALGRLTSDSVTSYSTSNIDTGVLRIDQSYNSQGLIDKVTSYSSATGGSGAIVNQIEDVYNGFDQLTAEYQEHSGSVNTSSSMSTLYGYSDGAHGSRPTSMTYPSGQVLYYNYGSSGSLNDVISRLDNLVGNDGSGGTTTLESYKYLGLSTVVQRTENQANITLTYIKQTGESNGDAGDKYTGLDRFGRVVDQRWIENASGSSIDRYQYTYDLDGNVASKTNGFDSTYDETYTYDNLNQLTNVTRNGTSNNYQSFGIDGSGNIDSLTNGTNSSLTLTQNDQNELTGFQTSSGNTITLAYDNNGNQTTDDHGYTMIYDAWNRLVEVKNGGTVIRQYSYDGTNRQVSESDSGANPTEFYYDTGGQVLEEDVDNSGLHAHAQYVWSPVYVNAMVYRDFDFNVNGSYSASERVYVVQDANYNVTALLTRYTQVGDGGSQDNVVDSGDLALVTNHWNQSVTGGDVNGDFNHDGIVDLTDLTIVTNHWDQTSTGSSWHVTERFYYDPYGKFTTKAYDDTGSFVSSNDFLSWDYQFQGGRYDSTTGLIDFQARQYSVDQMRFTRQDPMGYINGLDDYLFTEDNPIARQDPSGCGVTYQGSPTTQPPPASQPVNTQPTTQPTTNPKPNPKRPKYSIRITGTPDVDSKHYDVGTIFKDKLTLGYDVAPEPSDDAIDIYVVAQLGSQNEEIGYWLHFKVDDFGTITWEPLKHPIGTSKSPSSPLKNP